MAMRQGTHDLEAVGQGTDRFAPKHGLHGLDHFRGQLGEIGHSPMLDLAAFAIALAN